MVSWQSQTRVFNGRLGLLTWGGEGEWLRREMWVNGRKAEGVAAATGTTDTTTTDTYPRTTER